MRNGRNSLTDIIMWHVVGGLKKSLTHFKSDNVRTKQDKTPQVTYYVSHGYAMKMLALIGQQIGHQISHKTKSEQCNITQTFYSQHLCSIVDINHKTFKEKENNYHG